MGVKSLSNFLKNTRKMTFQEKSISQLASKIEFNKRKYNGNRLIRILLQILNRNAVNRQVD
jgi:hypothetical protein